MAGTGSRFSIIGPALAIGGLCLLGLIGLAIAAIIILSIIPTYTQQTSTQGNGEEYRMDQLVLRALTDSSVAYNRSIVDSPALSAACTKAMQTGGDASFYACVITNIKAANGTAMNATTTRRRKRYTGSLFLICTARVFFKSRCVDAPPNSGKNHTNTSTSACRTRRIAKINKIFDSKSLFDTSGLVTYLTYADGTVFSVLAGLYFVRYALYAMYAGLVTNGFAYLQQISLADINAIIAAQSTFTTTVASSTNVNSG